MLVGNWYRIAGYFVLLSIVITTSRIVLIDTHNTFTCCC